MNIIIVGAGNVGCELISQLSHEGHDITVVDNDAQKVQFAVDHYDVMGNLGSGASYDTLQHAGVSTSDLLIACTPQDEVNILCCLVGKKLGAKDTIARIRTPEYFTLFQGKELGLSMMVNPEHETALGISRILKNTSALAMEPFADGRLDLAQIKVTKQSKLDGIQLKDLNKHLSHHVLVCAVERGGKVEIPWGDFMLLDGDIIYITASSANMVSFLAEISGNKGCRSVMIIGGGAISFYLAKELEKINISVKIIESDQQRCQSLSLSLKKAEIILGDGTNQELLAEEGLNSTDALVALCPSDEQNIIISMYASSMHIKKVIAKVDNGSYYKMLRSTNIDSVVSTKTHTANQLARYVRSTSNGAKSKVNKVFSIVNDQVEAVEFIAGDDFKGEGQTLKDLKLRKGTLVANIVRNSSVIIPTGDDCILKDDTVLVVSKTEGLDDLNGILE